MIKNKNIFITGGAGFIANTLIKRLVKNNKIVIFDNFHRDTFSRSDLKDNDNIEVIKGDVLDYELVKNSMKGSDIVVHAAGIAGIDTVINNPVLTGRVNVIGN